ncbi:O-methyltransferase [Aspergillus similis]
MPALNGTKNTNGVNGATQVDSLLGNVMQTVHTFKRGKQERDRLAALKAAQELVRALHEPKDNVYHLVYSPTQAMCVRMGIDLEIFTSLSKSKEPVSLEDLAAHAKERILRILAGIGYVEEQDVRLYKATHMTRQMTDRDSIAVVKFIYDYGLSSVAKVPEFLRKHDYQFIEGLTSGPWNYAMNREEVIWEWFSADPERLHLSNSFMEADRGSRPSWVEWCSLPQQLVKAFDGGAEDVFMVDVAGGRGHDLKIFRDKFPDVKGQFILEDLGHVIEQSVGGLRAKKIAFDLFKEQPIKEKDCPMLSAMWDWEMMVFCNSFERSESHWRKVLSKAGFQAKFYYPPGDGQGIIKAELK